MGKQLTIWDVRDERAEPVFAPLGLVRLEPISTRELVDNLGQDADPHAALGTQSSGQQRAKMQAEVEEVLRAAFDAAQKEYGELQAAAMLLSICARDPAFDPPKWLLEVWLEYRDELREHFEGHGDDRQVDWSEGRDDDD